MDEVKKKKLYPLLEKVKFEAAMEGDCIQMLHLGSYDDEPASFKVMEEFAETLQVRRLSKTHREIYLSDARRVKPEKLKTILRFSIEPGITS